MKRAVWRTINVYAGTLVIGMPVMLAIAAVYTLGLNLVPAAIPLLIAIGPLGLWLWYLNSVPGRAARRVWLVAAVALALGAMISPWWFWSGPLLVVLTSEIIRVVTNPSVPDARRGVADPPCGNAVIRQ